jgi:hypothetical protein
MTAILKFVDKYSWGVLVGVIAGPMFLLTLCVLSQTGSLGNRLFGVLFIVSLGVIGMIWIALITNLVNKTDWRFKVNLRSRVATRLINSLIWGFFVLTIPIMYAGFAYGLMIKIF